MAALCLTGGASLAQRQDQVLWRDTGGQTKTTGGTVLENSLSKVRLDVGGRERDFDPARVERIVFGAVPPGYVDGVAYFDRGDFENAALKFQVAAGDASARDVVKAAARLLAAEAWMRRGAADPAAFEQARSDAERFLADFPDNREVPRARALLARAQWLEGGAAAAAELFRALYQEAQGETLTPGYSYAICYGAGLSAAEAFLDAGDVSSARTLYGELSAALTTSLASLPQDDPTRGAMSNMQARARLGEGFCLLADGSTSQAKTFFQGRLNEAGNSSALRFGAQLGLAEALLAEGNARQAQIEFAQVSAIDHTDRDNVARALVGLAECALKLPDTKGRQNAKLWLQTVRELYGDTPSILRAQELSQTL